MTPHPLALPCTHPLPSVRLHAQPRKTIPHLGNHILQLLMFLSPNGELQHHRFEFVMEIARCNPQLINLPMQIIDTPS